MLLHISNAMDQVLQLIELQCATLQWFLFSLQAAVHSCTIDQRNRMKCFVMIKVLRGVNKEIIIIVIIINENRWEILRLYCTSTWSKLPQVASSNECTWFNYPISNHSPPPFAINFLLRFSRRACSILLNSIWF